MDNLIILKRIMENNSKEAVLYFIVFWFTNMQITFTDYTEEQ
jgi:hypothetical protein